jgi:hypothetical protein
LVELRENEKQRGCFPIDRRMSFAFAEKSNTFPDSFSISGPAATFARFIPSSLSVIIALERYTDDVKSSPRNKLNDSYRKALLSDGENNTTAFLGNIGSRCNNSGNKQHLRKPKDPMLHCKKPAIEIPGKLKAARGQSALLGRVSIECADALCIADGDLSPPPRREEEVASQFCGC